MAKWSKKRRQTLESSWLERRWPYEPSVQSL
jgi:hypothetical protein